MADYRVFCVSSGVVSGGAEIGTLHLKGARVSIPAIIVGEEGRGRERGVVPVDNPPMVPCPDRGREAYIPPWGNSDRCPKCGAICGEPTSVGSHYRRHPANEGEVPGRLLYAEVGMTKAGKPKFFSKSSATTVEKIVVVFATKIGFRGSNSHTGDIVGWRCKKNNDIAEYRSCDAAGDEKIAPEACPKCGATGSWNGPIRLVAKFPGEVIARGQIAQGGAGRAGSGEQLVALMPKDVVFRTSYSGRLYGKPAEHYYKWDGERLLAATWDERAAADLF